MGILSNNLSNILTSLKEAKDTINVKYDIMGEQKIQQLYAKDLSSSIDKINCINPNDGNAEDKDLIKDKTAYAKGKQLIGSMKDNKLQILDGQIIEETSRAIMINMYWEKDKGYCDESTYFALPKRELAEYVGLNPDVLKRGEVILDVVGEYDPDALPHGNAVNKVLQNGNIINEDTNGDGIPDINIDTDNDDIPDLNIDITGNKKPDINIDTTGNHIPDLNIDTNRDNIPDINIDTTGDNKPNINIDLNDDNIPDVNIDTTGDKKPNVNIDTNNDNIPDYNIDTTGDNIPNKNIINKDNDGDNLPDVNIDTNGDNKPDINIDVPQGVAEDNYKVLSAFVSFGNPAVTNSNKCTFYLYYNKGRASELLIGDAEIKGIINEGGTSWDNYKILIDLQFNNKQLILAQAVVIDKKGNEYRGTITNHGGLRLGFSQPAFIQFTNSIHGNKMYCGICSQAVSNVKCKWAGTYAISSKPSNINNHETTLAELKNGTKFSFINTSNAIDAVPNDSANWDVNIESNEITHNSNSTSFNGIISSYGENYFTYIKEHSAFSVGATVTGSGNGAIGVVFAVACKDTDIETAEGDDKPDINIDTDGDNEPDVNIDTTGDNKPNINIDTNDDDIPDINIDVNDDGTPDYNIDDDGDGIADRGNVNIDIDGDGQPDLNIDTNNDGKPDINIDTDVDKTPDINVDTDGDNIADTDIDITGDNKPDVNISNNEEDNPEGNTNTINSIGINVDTTGDGIPDLNIDTNGDGIPDLNVDTDGDGYPDINIDTDGDGIADVNVDTNGDGKPDVNIQSIPKNGNDDINLSSTGTQPWERDTEYINVDRPLEHEANPWLLKWGWREIELADHLSLDKKRRMLRAYRRMYNIASQVYNLETNKDFAWYYDYTNDNKISHGYAEGILYVDDNYKIKNLMTATVNNPEQYRQYVAIYNKDLGLTTDELVYVHTALYTDCPELMLPFPGSKDGVDQSTFTITTRTLSDAWRDWGFNDMADMIDSEGYHLIGFAFPIYKEADHDKYINKCKKTFNDIAKKVYDTYGIKYNMNATPWTYSRRQKRRIVKVIHDYLVTNNVYGYSSIPLLDQTMYPALSQGDETPVCASYAMAFHYCCEKYGICTCNVFGDAGEAHQWNMVTYNPLHFRVNQDIVGQSKNWSDMDVTWDDPTLYLHDPNFCRWMYFNRSTKFFEEVGNHTREYRNTDYSPVQVSPGIYSYQSASYTSYPTDISKNINNRYLNGNYDSYNGGKLYAGF